MAKKLSQSSPTPKSYLADEERFKRMISEDTYLADGYLDGTKDMCDEIDRKLSQAQNFAELKTELLGLLKQRKEFAQKTLEWFP